MRHGTAGLFVLLAAVWGGSFVATRAALPDVPPVPLAALRFDVVAVLMLAYAVLATDRWHPRTRDEWRVVLLGGTLFVALHHALLFAGQRYVTSAVASVLVSLDPVLAAGFGWVLLTDERLDRGGLLGLGAGLLGVGVMANPTAGDAGAASPLGVLLVFLSAAAFALGAVLTRRYRTDLPVASMQAWMAAVGAPLLHLASVALPGSGFEAVEWSPAALTGLAYLTVVAGAFGYLLYFELLDRIGAVEINLIGYAAPPFAAVGGWVVLGEPVTGRTATGFVLVLVGFLLIKRRTIRAELARLRSESSGTS